MQFRMNLFASMVGIPPKTSANIIALIGGFSWAAPIIENKKVSTTMVAVA